MGCLGPSLTLHFEGHWLLPAQFQRDGWSSYEESRPAFFPAPRTSDDLALVVAARQVETTPGAHPTSPGGKPDDVGGTFQTGASDGSRALGEGATSCGVSRRPTFSASIAFMIRLFCGDSAGAGAAARFLL